RPAPGRDGSLPARHRAALRPARGDRGSRDRRRALPLPTRLAGDRHPLGGGGTRNGLPRRASGDPHGSRAGADAGGRVIAALTAGGIAFLVSLAATPLVRRLALRLGATDQ